MDFAELCEWEWVLPEIRKWENGDKTAFTHAGNFDPDSLDAELLARFAHYKPKPSA